MAEVKHVCIYTEANCASLGQLLGHPSRQNVEGKY